MSIYKYNVMAYKKYTKEELENKIRFHEDRANYYYEKLELLEKNKEIGFKYKGKK